MWGIYLHWPFCKKKCSYCDFFTTYPLSQLVANYHTVLLKELVSYKSPEPVVNSVYLGGGTPGLMTDEQLAAILCTIKTNFTLSPDAEITVEVNPNDLAADKLEAFYELGVNRLSVGVQSFQDKELRLLGRNHSAETARNLISKARNVGFKNITIDLIFALPGQTINDWEENLKSAVKTDVEHLSVYGLTWEKNTVFSRLKELQKLTPLSETDELDMYQLAQQILPAYGYEQYEISNYSKTGFHSQHNSLYWQDLPFLGVGASAASYDGNTRRHNVKSVRQYIKMINEANIATASSETLSRKMKMAETIFLALRTCKGLNKNAFNEKFEEPLEVQFGEIISNLVKENLLINTTDHLYIPQNKLVLADAIVREFL